MRKSFKCLIAFSFLFNGSLLSASTFFPKSFKAEFHQIFKSQISNKVKKTPMTIEYLYPRMIRLEVTSAEKTTFVSNAKKSWFYQAPFAEGEKGSVQIQAADQYLLSGFLTC